MKTENFVETKINKTIIECECGCCMLKVQSEVDFFNSNPKKFYQYFDFAMFNYGNKKRNFFDRIGIAFKYLKSGEMHKDQIVLTPDEAKKLADFIYENIVYGEINPMINV